MTILDAITSSPINVFFTIVIGIGLAYLYYRKPSSSSSSSSTSGTQSSSGHHHRHYPASAFLNSHSAHVRAGFGLDSGLGVVDEELQRSLALIERQERDMIRQEQDAAYYQSLKADREKKLKKEEEERDREAKERAERDERDRLEKLHQGLTKLKSEIRNKLPSDAAADAAGAKSDADNIVKLVFKLPDGTRIKRDFYKSDKVKYLHWFVFSLENAPLQFRMTTNFPKRELPGRPPMPEDFHEEHDNSNSETTTTTTNDSSSRPTTSTATTTTTTTPTSPSTTVTNNNGTHTDNETVEPNCELTLAEAGLTETQIIFVYDLEA